VGAIGDAKRLMGEAREKLAAADVDGANAAIDAANELLGKLGQIADDVTETELIKDLDAAVESVPEEFRALAQAFRGAIDHGIRVGTRASNATQELQACVSDVRSFLADLREGRVKFVTDTRVQKG